MIKENALGHKTFEKYSENQTDQQKSNPIFSVSAGTGKAYGMPISDGFVLLKGSSIHKVAAESLTNGIKKLQRNHDMVRRKMHEAPGFKMDE